MMFGRSLAMHGGILVVAGALALRAFTSDDEESKKHLSATVWNGQPSAITMVRFEHDLGEMTIEPRQDSEGRYFVGTVVKDKAAEEKEKKNPHDPHGAQSEPEKVKPTGERTTASFIAVSAGEDLFEQLAPLEAIRVLGDLDPAREKDFGFDEVQGSLYVSVGGTDHTLVFGGSTPGGSDHYVRESGTGKAYVVPGSILRDLMSADQRLVERDLHAFDDSKVERVVLALGDAKRTLVRNVDKNDFWSSPDSPGDKDETASNFMEKLGRLRVTSYAGDKPQPPVQPADVVIRIEYFDDRKKLGFLELVRRPGDGERPEYIARTEHTRWYAGVLRSAGEQIDQDVKSVVGQ